MKTPFNLDQLDVEQIFDCLLRVGAASARILNDDFRLSLLKEAEGYTYKPDEEIVGSADRIVRQQLSSFDGFSDASNYLVLKDAFQALVDRSLATLKVYPFKTPLRFNSMVLQKYDSGSLGITPHRDHLSYINVVCIFVVGGGGKFHICVDRSGAGAKEIPARPGDVILMRGAGFLGTRNRPFHCVTDIQQSRYTLGLRQHCPQGSLHSCR